MKKYSILVVALTCFALPGIAKAADGLFLGYEYGRANPSSNGVNTEDYDAFVVGYQRDKFSFQVEALDFSYFTQTGLFNNRLEVTGVSAAVNKINKTKILDYYIGIGLIDWDVDAYLREFRIGEDSGTSPMIRLGISKTFLDRLTMNLGVSHYNDVSGSNIDTIATGIRYKF